ncbi:hypothetical protein EIP91_002151 [Steccherinum ochraceum]|uniref:Uncharacterized protein n=1 Tax=Steccherinum ochraceum TaxID=92696 RepID=A0A4R0RJ15_9APHY|nr:hypothetical protein EIP91_002151 [Steccherinum ochraceum]
MSFPGHWYFNGEHIPLPNWHGQQYPGPGPTDSVPSTPYYTLLSQEEYQPTAIDSMLGAEYMNGSNMTYADTVGGLPLTGSTVQEYDLGVQTSMGGPASVALGQEQSLPCARPTTPFKNLETALAQCEESVVRQLHDLQIISNSLSAENGQVFETVDNFRARILRRLDDLLPNTSGDNQTSLTVHGGSSAPTSSPVPTGPTSPVSSQAQEDVPRTVAHPCQSHALDAISQQSHYGYTRTAESTASPQIDNSIEAGTRTAVQGDPMVRPQPHDDARGRKLARWNHSVQAIDNNGAKGGMDQEQTEGEGENDKDQKECCDIHLDAGSDAENDPPDDHERMTLDRVQGARTTINVSQAMGSGSCNPPRNPCPASTTSITIQYLMPQPPAARRKCSKSRDRSIGPKSVALGKAKRAPSRARA